MQGTLQCCQEYKCISETSKRLSFRFYNQYKLQNCGTVKIISRKAEPIRNERLHYSNNELFTSLSKLFILLRISTKRLRLKTSTVIEMTARRRVITKNIWLPKSKVILPVSSLIFKCNKFNTLNEILMVIKTVKQKISKTLSTPLCISLFGV